MSAARPLRAAVLGLAVALASVGPATAQGTYTINLRNTDITAFAEQVSTITGRTLVLDPDLEGEVTVVSAQPLDADGVWALFQSILQVRGYVAVSNGILWQVVPEGQARSVSGPIAGNPVTSQDMVTQLLRLDRLPAEEAVRVLGPLVDEAGYIEALPEPNAIVVTDLRANVDRVLAIARQFDAEADQRSEVVRFDFAEAQSVAQAIGEVLGSAGTGARLSVDPVANLLLVRGSEADIDQIRQIARAMDVAPRISPREAVTTQVFRLSHGDAEVVAQVLVSTLTGGAQLTNPVAEAVGTPEAAAARTGQGAEPSPVSITPSSETNSVLVRGTARQIAEVADLIHALDVRRAQVMIEAAIVEISGQLGQRLGVQFGLDDAQAPAAGFAATSFSNAGVSLQSVLAELGSTAAGALSTGLSIGATGNDFGVLVQALNQSTNANLLSTPSVTTMDNQAATIVVGQNVPFRTGEFATDGNTVTPFTTIERRDVGITLKVLPRVTAGGIVRLDIDQEISALVPTTVDGAADLITNRREISTTVLARDGGTVVLGGLITDDDTAVENKVPGLGDVPVLGGLFRARSNAQTQRTLFVFMRPTILHTDAQAQAAAERSYTRTRKAEAHEVPRPLPRAQPVRKLPLEIDGLY